MRYTTIIDITEQAAVYRNKNCRLLYLHLALVAGYHSEDRDVVSLSFRQLAAGCGLTLSATRHALGILETSGLVKREGAAWNVTKFVVAAPPPPRTQKAARQGQQAKGIAEQYDQQIHEWAEQVKAAVRDMTRDELIKWRDELKEARSLCHRGVYLPANQRNIAWLESIIEQL